MVASNEYQQIVQTISKWPIEDRASLIRALIEGMKAPANPSPTKLTMSDLIGIARGDGTPPTDVEVKQWIDDHRMEKYGR